MKTRLPFLLTLLCSAWLARAAVPPVEQLLPADTIVVGTVPDWEKSSAAWGTSPAARLWADEAMKPFREKFMAKLKTDVIEPVEKELGIKLADYSGMMRGQVTIALVQNGWQGQSDVDPAVVLIIDTRDKSEQLKKTLGDLRKRWTDGGKTLKTEKIRDLDFHTIVINNDDLEKTFNKIFPSKEDDAGPAEPSGKKTEVTFGQSESLLLVSNIPKVLEKIVIRQGGGQVPVLAEQAGYEASQPMFRDSVGYGWVNFRIVMDLVAKAIGGKSLAEGAPPGLDLKPEKMMDALGLNGLRHLAFSVSQTSEGGLGQFFIGTPESGRRGLLKMMAVETKEAGPLPFVPADVTKFTRVRLDGQKLWSTLEAMMTDLSPQVAGIVQMTIAAAGKDRDPNFDVKKMVIGNLGDDIIALEKKPRSASMEDLASPPSLFLLGSPNAEQLAGAIKTATSFMAMAAPGGAPPDREFLGRKIYTLPPTPGQAGTRPLSFAASGGYVAFSTDAAILEEYLRSSENPGKPLREVAGLMDAAQKVGGTEKGLFGYENQTETVRLLLEALKRDPGAFEKMFVPNNPLAPPPDADAAKKRQEWLDFTLLPPFERIAKYFNFSVFAGSVQADGYRYKIYSPNPPGL